MNEKYKSFPICINCKYFMEEKTGPMQVKQNCGLTMIDPVTGELQPRRHRQAAAYRKESNPCGPSGLFFKPKEGEQVEPAKKPVKVEVKKESTAKVTKVEVPEMNELPSIKEQIATWPDKAKENASDLFSEIAREVMAGEDKEATEEPPKRRKNRKK